MKDYIQLTIMVVSALILAVLIIKNPPHYFTDTDYQEYCRVYNHTSVYNTQLCNQITK